MPKKLSVKKIIELDNAGMSGRDIAILIKFHYRYFVIHIEQVKIKCFVI